MTAFDDAWVAAVRAAGDAVLVASGIFLGSQVIGGPGQAVVLLWEADPSATDARFPALGLAESYGDSLGDASCIDLWLHVDTADGRARTSFEGGTGDDVEVRLSGDAEVDATVVERLLEEHLTGPG